MPRCEGAFVSSVTRCDDLLELMKMLSPYRGLYLWRLQHLLDGQEMQTEIENNHV